MKHSRKIALVLLGTVSAVALAACDDDKPREGQAIYESVEQCRDSGGSDCDTRFAQALSNHIATGPRYSSQEACMERGHERCTNVSSGATDIWLPAMVGFMVGRALDSTRPVYLQGYENPSTERERQDRQVVAGGTRSGGGAVFVGSYHGAGAPYSSGSLGSGMSAGAARAGISTPAASVGGRATAAPSAAARGGFGAAGAGAAGA